MGVKGSGKRSLLAIHDNYKKIILTMDREKNKQIEEN